MRGICASFRFQFEVRSLPNVQLKVGQGTGEFVQLPCFSEHVYNRIDAMQKAKVCVCEPLAVHLDSLSPLQVFTSLFCSLITHHRWDSQSLFFLLLFSLVHFFVHSFTL